MTTTHELLHKLDPSVGLVDRFEYSDPCPRCRSSPANHPNPAGLCDPCHADVVQRTIASIRVAVLQALQPPELDCCLACGCLVLPDEHCPGCAANRRASAAATATRPLEAA